MMVKCLALLCRAASFGGGNHDRFTTSSYACPCDAFGSTHRAAVQHQDALDEIKHAKAHTVALADAQIAAAKALRRDMAAAALCRETIGESLISWTASGELVCVPRRYIRRGS